MTGDGLQWQAIVLFAFINWLAYRWSV